jgi:hypothetical protein
MYSTVAGKMRLKLILLLIVIFSNKPSLKAQELLFGTWVDKHLGILKLEKRKAELETWGFESYKLKIKGSILKLREIGFRVLKPDYIFKIDYLSRDTLILIPINSHSKIMMGSSDPQVFRNRNSFHNENIKLESIYFSAQPWYGFFHRGFTIQIDSIGRAYLKDGVYYSKKDEHFHWTDSTTLIAQLSSQQLDSLKEMIKTCEIDSLPGKLEWASEIQDLVLMIKWNGKTKISSGKIIPEFFSPLFLCLRKIQEDLDWSDTGIEPNWLAK